MTTPAGAGRTRRSGAAGRSDAVAPTAVTTTARRQTCRRAVVRPAPAADHRRVGACLLLLRPAGPAARRAGRGRLHLRRGRRGARAGRRTRRSAATRPRPASGVRRAAAPLETLIRLFLLQAPVAARRRRARRCPAWSTGWRVEGLLERTRRRGRRPARRPPLRHRRPRPVGRQRPDPRPRRQRRPGRRRPRPRHQLGLDARWPSSPSASRSAGPSTSAPAAACRRCTSPPTPARSSPPTSTARALRLTRFNAALNEVAAPVDVRDGLVLRAGRGRALRPDRHQPAVRDLAGDRGAAGLPRLRPARRPRRRGHRPRRARPPHRRRLVPGAGQLGRSPTACRGTSGSAGWLPDGLRRATSCSARCSTRRRTSSSGSRTPACTARPDYLRRYDTWLSWFEEQGIEARRLRLDQPAPQRRRRRAELLEWPYDVEQPIAPAIRGLGRRSAATPVVEPRLAGLRGARRRPPGDRRARPAPRTPRRSCCASSAACAGPARSTPSRPRWSGPATAT